MGLSVFRLDLSGKVMYTWQAVFNSRGIEATRISEDDVKVELCGFETFLYPDAVEDEELMFMDVVAGSPVKEDHNFIKLCSHLVAQFTAGHHEETMHDNIRETLKRWSEKTT